MARTLPLIAAGRTYAEALASAEEMVRGDGYGTDLQRAAVPVLAAAAVLAHRQGLTNASLRVRLLGGDGGPDALMTSDGDDDVVAAAAVLRRFLAGTDLDTSARRNVILTEAAALLVREPTLRRQARSKP